MLADGATRLSQHRSVEQSYKRHGTVEQRYKQAMIPSVGLRSDTLPDPLQAAQISRINVTLADDDPATRRLNKTSEVVHTLDTTPSTGGAESTLPKGAFGGTEACNPWPAVALRLSATCLRERQAAPRQSHREREGGVGILGQQA